jgi:hypothetical protein
MRTILLTATALALLFSGAVYAQSSPSGGTSTAVDSSGSRSASVFNPKGNVIGNPIGNGASSSNSGAKAIANTRSDSRSAAVGNVSRTNVTVNSYAGIGDPSSGIGASGATPAGGSGGSPAQSEQYIGYGGGYTVRNTPEVIPPSVVGGNPCAVGASGGVSLPGFGIAAGGTWADRACERRQQSALLFNMNKPRAAVELLCQDEHVREAMRLVGEPCVADIAPVAAAASVAAAAPPVAAVIAPVSVVAPKPVRPEWCYTASSAELRRNTTCDIKS